MTTPGDEPNDDSDVEADDPESPPIVINTSSSSSPERRARIAAETSKSELQLQFDRLRKRDEALRQKDEVTAELAESNKRKEEFTRRFDDVVKEKGELRDEIAKSTHMLTSGIEKISGKARSFTNSTAGELPRSSKYAAGLPAVAYGVIKRTNEIVEELVRQVEASSKTREEAREQMDHRHYDIGSRFRRWRLQSVPAPCKGKRATA